MKLTKKEISQINLYWSILQSYFKGKEENKATFIKYGWFSGRIKQIIMSRVYYDDKDLHKNENTDEYLREQFGDEFIEWLCNGHRRYAYNDTRTMDEIIADVAVYETADEAKDRKMRELVKSLNIKG